MKKIARNKRIGIPSIIVYLDQIKEVNEILQSSYEDIDVSFVNKDDGNEYKLQNIDELQGVKAKRIEFYATNSNAEDARMFSLHLSNNGRISISEDCMKSQGVASEILKVLTKHKRLFHTFLDSWKFVLLWGGVLALQFNAYKSSTSTVEQALAKFSLILVFLTFVLVVGFLKSIIFRLDYLQPSFWQRNKDKLIISVINLIAGAIIYAVINSFR